MHFSTLATALFVMAIPSIANPAAPPVDSAATWVGFSKPGCEQGGGIRDEHQNVPRNVCDTLNGAVSLRLYFLQKPPQCLFRVYTGANCTGTFDTFTPSDYPNCKDVSQRHSYKVVNC